jgi:hypothetical protein
MLCVNNLNSSLQTIHRQKYFILRYNKVKCATHDIINPMKDCYTILQYRNVYVIVARREVR